VRETLDGHRVRETLDDRDVNAATDVLADRLTGLSKTE
jgi:hypothetical protein